MAQLIARGPAERRLLAAVLRGELDPASLSAEERARFRHAAEAHGLAALLERRDPGLAPAAAGIRFAAILAGATTRRALHALGDAGIEALVIKGLAVACLAWDDPSSRVQTDVDLLVRREDMQRAIAALQSAGVSGDVALSGDTLHAATLAPAPGGATIEVHHALSDDALRDVRVADILARGMVVQTPEGPVRTMGLADMAVYLTVHATLHLFDRLSWLVDLAGLARRQPVDWIAAARRAREWNAEAATELGWRAAVDLAGAAIPEAAFEALGARRAQTAIAAGLLRAAQVLEHPARRPLAVAFRLACTPSLSMFAHKVQAIREKQRERRG